MLSPYRSRHSRFLPPAWSLLYRTWRGPALRSSASIAIVAVIALGATTLAQDASLPRVIELPSLGNDPESDLLMSREVGDEHLFTPDPATVSGNPEQPASDTAVLQSTSSVLDAKAQTLPEAATGLDDELDVPEVVDVTARWDAESDDPWQRILAANSLQSREHEIITRYRQQYIAEAMWIGRIFERSRPYIRHLVDELNARFLPPELALLPAIESGFRPNVVSAGKASGLWQIVPITAEEIGIKRDAWFDGRSDIKISTTAAIDYLSYLNAEFNGDWELTLAAYNAGPGRVRAAIRKNMAEELPTDYWSLSLPQETRNYVPKLLALIDVMKQEEGLIPLPALTDTDGFEEIDIGLRISVDKAAKLAGIDATTLELLNAGLTHGITPPDGPHTLYVPPEAVTRLRQHVADADPKTLFSPPKTHVVKAGDTISDIATRYGMTQTQLKDINALTDSTIRIGQQLAVRDAREAEFSTIEYVVAIGDTLSDIAERHSVNVSDIQAADGTALADHLIHPGETLNIGVALGAAE